MNVTAANPNAPMRIPETNVLGTVPLNDGTNWSRIPI